MTRATEAFGGRQNTRPKVALEDHRKSGQPGEAGRTLAEQETVVRFDRTGGPASLWTADINQARRWVGRGYPVEPVSGGWRAEVPKAAITFRSLSAVKGDEARESASESGSAACAGCGAALVEGETVYTSAAGVTFCADCGEMERLMAEEAAS